MDISGPYVKNFITTKLLDAKRLCKECVFTLDEINFIQWIDQIERKIISAIGLNLLDLPDQDYMMLFENKYTMGCVIKLVSDDFYNNQI
jgi:hypothetical protein